MTARPVEAVLVVFYGPEAHHVTYGRAVRGGGYTKDYIQLSRKPEFLDWAKKVFPRPPGTQTTVSIRYEWPGASAPGDFVYLSADRPHLKWETSLGAPPPWRMTESPSDSTAQTIPGNPNRVILVEAEREYTDLRLKGAGQPYLVAIKLRGESNILHVRAYLDGASAAYDWARLDLLPAPVRELAMQTTQRRASSWATYGSYGTAPDAAVEAALQRLQGSKNIRSALEALSREDSARLVEYLLDPGEGFFFDPTRNHDAWIHAPAISQQILNASPAILDVLADLPAKAADDDLAAEMSASDTAEVEILRGRMQSRDYSVPDSTSSVKTRGSAQRAFAEAVKANYGYRCAITGITTPAFLIASHIVPWSADQTIRLDPTNGICLSLLVDRAFEAGHLRIEDDLTIRIDRARIGEDQALLVMLQDYDGQQLNIPSRESPRVSYLQRRRELVDGVYGRQ